MKALLKQAIFAFAIAFYIFVLLGFILHTSPHPTILHKYSLKYGVALFGLIIAFLPYVFLIWFLFKDSKFKLKNKKFVIKPTTKLIVFIFVILGVYLLTMKIYEKFHKPDVFPYALYMTNFHPFLQSKLTLYNNKDNRELHINSDGFRYDELQKEKTTDTYRIFVMGGSTVLNAGIPYEKQLVRLLEKKLQANYPLKKIQVINAGNSAYTSEHSIIQYLFKIRDFRPDLIIMWQGANDMYYSCENIGTLGPYQEDYSNSMGNLYPIIRSYYDPKPIVSINFFSHDLFLNVFPWNFYSDLKSNLQSKKETEYRYSAMSFPSIKSFERNMDLFAKNVISDNTKLILGNQPFVYTNKSKNAVDGFVRSACGRNNIYPQVSSLIDGFNQFNTISKQTADKYGVGFLDLNSAMPKTTEYFTDDIHFTEKGNTRIADVLYDFIASSYVLLP